MLLKGHNHEAIKKELQDYLLELGKTWRLERYCIILSMEGLV
jgi:hypothetical protein